MISQPIFLHVGVHEDGKDVTFQKKRSSIIRLLRLYSLWRKNTKRTVSRDNKIPAPNVPKKSCDQR
jgi:hypothetical protein